MPNIEYVCISDMHFGADNSVLTNLGVGDGKVDASIPSAVLVKLVDCLRELISHNPEGKRPTLLLNGDIFEFALSTDNVAAMAFQRFMELAMPARTQDRLFANKIIYIPGNHDHHLWESAREKQYADYLQGNPAQTLIDGPWHTTKIIDADPIESAFAQAVVRRCSGLSDVSVGTVYPNLGIINGEKLVIFTHGHFTEDIYILMSTLSDVMFPSDVRPRTTYQWEGENFAWIDFFWSTMGRSGPVGPEVELLYETMQNPARFGAFVGDAAKGLLQKYGGATGRHLGWLLALLVKSMIADRLERAQPEKPLSDDGAGLRRYLDEPVRLQLEAELEKRSTPGDVTVVFGHTHKPFEQMMKFDKLSRRYVRVYNSGGWVVDRPKPQELFGGAVIMFDEDLNALSLRMYNESNSATDYKVAVNGLGSTPSSPSHFLKKVQSLVTPDKSPWSDFSRAAAEAVNIHTRKLARIINRS
jgi:hypothetical protein